MTELLTGELDGGGDPLDEQVAGAAVVGAVVGDGHTSQPQLVCVPNLGKWWHIHCLLVCLWTKKRFKWQNGGQLFDCKTSLVA